MRTPTSPQRAAAAAFCAAALSSPAAWAGRPLTVDDANVDAPGASHVESWRERLPGPAGASTPGWTTAPVFGLADRLELDTAYTRDMRQGQSASRVQLKYLWTPPQDRGCNSGSALGLAHFQAQGGMPAFYGLLSCNLPHGAVHLNLGAQRPPGGPVQGTWGIAYEHTFGPVTGHVETFGQRQSLPTRQAGLRVPLRSGFDINGTLGRQGRTTVYSLGATFALSKAKS